MFGRTHILFGLSLVLGAGDRDNYLVGLEPAECYLGDGAFMSPSDASKDSIGLLYLFDVLWCEEFVLVSDVPLWNMLSIVLAREGSLRQRTVSKDCDVALPAVGKDLLFDFSL